jgi:anti-anti-sigma regulatory factor
VRSFFPRLTELGRIGAVPGLWLSRERYHEAARVAGVRAWRLDGELHYGNIQSLIAELTKQLHEAVVSSSEDEGVAHTGADSPATPSSRGARQREVYAPRLRGAPQGGNGGERDDDGEAEPLRREEARTAHAPTSSATPAHRALRGVVLDCTRVVHIDGTACRELRDVVKDYTKAGVVLLFVAVPGPVRDVMEAYGVHQHWRFPKPSAALGDVTGASAPAMVAAAGAGAGGSSGGTGSASASADSHTVCLRLLTVDSALSFLRECSEEGWDDWSRQARGVAAAGEHAPALGAPVGGPPRIPSATRLSASEKAGVAVTRTDVAAPPSPRGA